METAMAIAHMPIEAVELLKLTMESMTEDVHETDTDVNEAVASFMSELALTVADPTDKRNLTLPARELRRSPDLLEVTP
jgi:hypothetical protein